MKNIQFMGHTKIGRVLYDLDCQPMVVNPSSIGDESGSMREVDENKLKELIYDRWLYEKIIQVVRDVACTIIQEENIGNLSYRDVPLHRTVSISRYSTLHGFFYCMWPYYMEDNEAYALEAKYLDRVPSIQKETINNIIECIGIESRNIHGRFSKRFSSYMKKVHGYKMTEEEVSLIGNIYNECRIVDREFLIRITNNFSWQDGQFGKDDSCWWGCYSESRDTLYYYGGYAALFYPVDCADVDDDYSGIGRVWIYPVNDDLVITFNSYGNEGKVSAAVVAKLLEKLMGKSYMYGRRELVNNCGDDDNDRYPYINGDNGHNNDGGAKCFAIFSSNRPDNVIEIDMERKCGYFSERECYRCCRLSSGTEADDDNFYCDDCYNHVFTSCEDCGDEVEREDARHFEDDDGYYCYDCFNRNIEFTCEWCGDSYRNDDGITAQSGEHYCVSCANRRFDYCAEHEVYTYQENCSQCSEQHEEIEE